MHKASNHKFIKMIILFAGPIIITGIAPAFAYAMDCTKAKSALEKLICGDRELKSTDAALSQTYFKLLKASQDDEVHGLLIASQRRWVKIQEDENKNASLKDKPLILAAMQSRLYSLGGGKITPTKAPIIVRIEEERKFASQYTGGPFSGYEIQCWSAPEGFGDGALVCVGSQTFQNNDRICRSTTEWASAHETEYRTVAKANGTNTKMIATCSTGYASTDFECPQNSEFANKEALKSQKWNRQPTVTDSVPALKVRDDSNPLAKLDPDAEEFEDQYEWLSACLADENYPLSAPAKP